jgi:Flp pilus assembly protein TadG
MNLPAKMMNRMTINFIKLFERWCKEERAVAATEAALLFPVLMSLLMGVYDIGNGIVVNQKTITASQIIADLVTRNQVVDMDLVSDITIAGRMALEPFSATPMGYDIASIEFDEDDNPVVLWRITNNMDPNDAGVDSTEIIGEEGQGVVVVSVNYQYRPFFAHFVVDQINMQEVAFLRGRRSATVECTDCPAG